MSIDVSESLGVTASTQRKGEGERGEEESYNRFLPPAAGRAAKHFFFFIGGVIMRLERVDMHAAGLP